MNELISWQAGTVKPRSRRSSRKAGSPSYMCSPGPDSAQVSDYGVSRVALAERHASQFI